MTRARAALMGRPGALLAILTAALLGACGESDARLDLRPGDSLLDHVDHGRLRGLPVSTAPTDWAGRLASDARAAVVVGPEAWTPAEALPQGAKDLWDLPDEAEIWQPVGGTLAVAPDEITSVTVDGRAIALLPARATASLPEGMRAWQDRASGQFVSWSEAGVRLVAPGRPGRLVALTERDAREVLAESDLPPGDRPSALLTSGEFGDVLRPALRLPSPASLTFSLGELACDTLRVSLGVLDRGVDLTGDLLTLSPQAGDGVTFRIDVEYDGTTQTIFTRHLAPGDGWVDATADLTPWLGRNLRLVLAADAGPDADVAFDEALWADLALLGPLAHRPERPSLVVVDLDTLRADRLSTYGHHRATSPGLDAWIERWGPRTVVFEDCLATSSWTLPSTMSLLTGLAVHQHGVDHSSKALAREVPTLAERLADAGYETLAVTESGFVDPIFGFARGFDRYETQMPHEAAWSATLERLAERRSERPFFLLLHTYRAHAPYHDDDAFEDPAAPYGGWLAGKPLAPKALTNEAAAGARELDEADRVHIDRLYDAGVRRLDETLSAFLQELDRILPASSVLVVITSDHGEELWDRGGVDHGHSLHRELLHVPLIVRFPERLPGQPARSPVPVSLLDVGPTLLAAAGLDTPGEFPGTALQRRLGPGGDAPHPRVGQLDERLWSIQQDGHKLILPGAAHPHQPPRLYDLTADPGEHHDRAAEDRQRVSALRDLLGQFRRAHPAGAAAGRALPEDDTLDVLEQLGYVGER